MPEEIIPDETLMDAYVDGDAQAFEQLFARLAPRVHRFFMSSFRDRAVADDLRRRHRASARASEEELSAAEDTRSTTPEQDLVQADRAAQVRRALEQLP